MSRIRTVLGRSSSRRGFSLLELSVVLGIISLIAGVGMTMATGALKAADRVATQEKLNTIKLALDSHLKTYGYLPCPFDRVLVPSDATFGVENRISVPGANCKNDTGTASYVKNSNVATGGVPVRTLGLPDSYASDAWGNKLTYAVTEALTNDPSRAAVESGALVIYYGTLTSKYTISSTRNSLNYTSVASSGGPNLARLTFASTGSLANNKIVHVNGTVYKGSYAVANLTGTTIDLTGSTYSATDTGSVTWQDAGTAATYVVVSHGPDGRGAYPTNSNATSPPAKKKCNDSATANSSPPPCTDSGTTSCIDIENCNNDFQFFDTAYNDGPTAAQYFDDYIVWGSNEGLRPAVNTTLYSTCPTGICEGWCAACTVNFPGGGTTPPVSTNVTSRSDTILCKKVVTTNASSCGAYCFWSVTTASGYQKCP